MSTKICLLCETVVCDHYSSQLDQLTAERDTFKHEFKMLQAGVPRLQDEIEQLKKERDKLKELFEGSCRQFDEIFGERQYFLEALWKIKTAKCPNYMAHPQSVWWEEHVQSIADKAIKDVTQKDKATQK